MLKQAIDQSAEWVGDHDIYAMLVDSAALQEDLEMLKIYAPLAERTSAQIGHRLYGGIANRAWGMIHLLEEEYSQAESRLLLALEIFNGIKTGWQAGRTCETLWRLFDQQGKKSRAEEFLNQAKKNYLSVGATKDLQKLP